MNFFNNNSMNFFEYRAAKVWFTDTEIFVELEDGKQASLLIKSFPLLFNALPEQLEKFIIIGGYALYWPDLGEDLSVAGFFESRKNDDLKSPQSLSAFEK